MLSRRQFFTMTLIMLVIFFLFQITGVMKDRWNTYDENEYTDTSVAELDSGDAYQILEWDARDNAAKSAAEDDAAKAGDSVSQQEDTDMTAQSSDARVALLGDTGNTAVGKMAELWCSYTKRNLLCGSSLSELVACLEDQSRTAAASSANAARTTGLSTQDLEQEIEVLLIDSAYLDLTDAQDVSQLQTLAEGGLSMIFLNLPEVQTMKAQPELLQLLGIRSVPSECVTLSGIELFDGFLLGGRTIYEAEDEDDERQDMDLEVPWYEVRSGTKTYMTGLLDETVYAEELPDNESLPAIIWRNSIGMARIFAVNGSYMEEITALGILNAMMYELEEYVLYPVVNAQSFVTVNYAGLTSEQNEAMQERYTRSQKLTFQDVIWPSLVSLYTHSGDRLTIIPSVKLDYESEEAPDGKELIYYMKLFREAEAETGLSTYQTSEVPIDEKMETDLSFYRAQIPSYTFRSLYVDPEQEESCSDLLSMEGLADIRTVYLGEDAAAEPFSYIADNVTVQRATADGFRHTFSDNFRLKSLETGLGYSSILVDMASIVLPQSDEDRWEKRADELSSYTITYWKPFAAFEKTVLSESDSRIRRFLSLGYAEAREENVITLQVDADGQETYFLLRTHNEEISQIEGGSFEEIETHAYLISAQEARVEITLKQDADRYYTYP